MRITRPSTWLSQSKFSHVINIRGTQPTTHPQWPQTSLAFASLKMSFIPNLCYFRVLRAQRHKILAPLYFFRVYLWLKGFERKRFVSCFLWSLATVLRDVATIEKCVLFRKTAVISDVSITGHIYPRLFCISLNFVFSNMVYTVDNTDNTGQSMAQRINKTL